MTRGGVFFSRAGTVLDGAGPLTEVLLATWPTDRRTTPARMLDALLDPLPAWTPGGAMIAGFASPAALRPRAPSWWPSRRAESARSARSRCPSTADAPHPEEAVDLAFAPLDSGALLAWIDDPVDHHARRLALARVTCQRAPAARAPAAPHIVGMQNP